MADSRLIAMRIIPNLRVSCLAAWLPAGGGGGFLCNIIIGSGVLGVAVGLIGVLDFAYFGYDIILYPTDDHLCSRSIILCIIISMIWRGTITWLLKKKSRRTLCIYLVRVLAGSVRRTFSMAK